MKKNKNTNHSLLSLEERLSGRIHMSDIHEIALSVVGNDSKKQGLYNLIFSEDAAAAINSLWIITHFSAHENKWLYSKQDEMIDRLLLATNTFQRRLLLSVLYKQPLAETPRIDFLDYCLNEIISRKEAPGTTALCMKLAYEMCRPIPELLQEFKTTLDILEPNTLPPSLRTTKNNILKAMKTRKSLQTFS